MSETEETDYTEVADSEDSSVIRKLRKQAEDAQAEAEKWKEEAEQAWATEQQRRLGAVEGWINDLGDPEQQQAVKTLIESSSDALSVVEALAAQAKDPEPAASTTQTSAGATELGQKVFEAATGTLNLTLDEQLEKAETPEEIAAIMAEAGLVD